MSSHRIDCGEGVGVSWLAKTNRQYYFFGSQRLDPRRLFRNALISPPLPLTT